MFKPQVALRYTSGGENGAARPNTGRVTCICYAALAFRLNLTRHSLLKTAFRIYTL
jgi:hypothetical protein